MFPRHSGSVDVEVLGGAKLEVRRYSSGRSGCVVKLRRDVDGQVKFKSPSHAQPLHMSADFMQGDYLGRATPYEKIASYTGSIMCIPQASQTVF